MTYEEGTGGYSNVLNAPLEIPLIDVQYATH